MLRRLLVGLVVFLLFSTARNACFAAEFSMPFFAPEFGTPPRSYHDSPLVSITFKTTPAALQKLIPKPMRPNKDNLISLYVGRFHAPDYRNGEQLFKGDSYLEAGFVVPVSVENQSGGYSLVLYLNKTGPAISGREIWGFPKKEAEIAMVDDGGTITITMERLGAMLLQASFQKGEKVVPPIQRPPRPRYNLKFIPSVRKNAPPDVMQLTSYMQETKVKEYYKGKATLQLGGSSVDPLNSSIPVVEIVKAEYMVIDGIVDYGEVIYDYLKEGKSR